MKTWLFINWLHVNLGSYGTSETDPQKKTNKKFVHENLCKPSLRNSTETFRVKSCTVVVYFLGHYLPDRSVNVIAYRCSLELSPVCLVMAEISTWNLTWRWNMAGPVDPLLYSTRNDIGLETEWLSSAIWKKKPNFINVNRWRTLIKAKRLWLRW